MNKYRYLILRSSLHLQKTQRLALTKKLRLKVSKDVKKGLKQAANILRTQCASTVHPYITLM